MSLRKITAGLAAVVLGLTGTAVVVSSPAANAAGPVVNVNVFSFNDYHGRINNDLTLRWAYTLENAVLNTTGVDPADSLVVSGGDSIGATEFASAIAQDQPTIDLLNLIAGTPGINFPASTVGNHEFDQGWPDLKNRVVPKATWQYLAANVVDSTGKTVLPAYAIQTLASGIRVGIIGAVTQEVPSLVSPGGLVGLTFTDPVAAVNKIADQIKGTEADVIIAIYHDGASVQPPAANLSDAIQASASFAKIANGTSSKVDAIFGGHTHMAYAWTGTATEDPKGLYTHAGRPLVEAGSYGSHVGQVTLTVDTSTMTVTAATAKLIPTVKSTATDTDPNTLGNVDFTLGSMAAIKTMVAKAVADANILGLPTVGKVSADITTAFGKGTWAASAGGLFTYQNVASSAIRDDRANEASLANLVADSFLATAKTSTTIGGADIGIINTGGGLRAELYYAPDGIISYSEANAVLPFANNVSTVELTGAQFKQFLEEQWQTLADGTTRPTRPFLATGVSTNVTYTVNTDQGAAAPCTLEAKCSWTDAASHVTSVFVNGVPLQADKTYKIVTLTFLTTGGDNYRVLTQGKNITDAGIIDRDAWISYLMSQSGVSAPGGTPTKAIAPDFARRSVVVTNLTPATAPMSATKVTAGQPVTASLSRLNLTSLGSPANTSLDIYLVPIASAGKAPTAAMKVGTAGVTAPGDTAGCTAAGVSDTLNPLSTGCAKLNVTIPAKTATGTYILTAIAQPTGTTVSIWLEVKGLASGGGTVETGGMVATTTPWPVAALGLLMAGTAGVLIRKYALQH